MKINRVNEITKNFLINATQMAFLERAEATYTMLEKFSEFYRYLIRKTDICILFDELEVLKMYIFIKKNIYGEKLNVHFENEEQYKNVYIKHLSIIDYFDEILLEEIININNDLNINFIFEIEEKIRLNVEVDSNKSKKLYSQVLWERWSNV